MTERIQKTLDFLNKTFDVSDYWKVQPSARQYRYDHTMRVARAGREIAENENLDAEAIVVACLLHDCCYGLDFDISKSWTYKELCPEMEGYDKLGLISIHGYISALHSKKFVEEELGYSGELLDNIINAIGHHTKVPENGKISTAESVINNVFVKTIRDADEIDHESTFRLFEDITKFDFTNKTQEERQQYIWGTKGYQEHRINGWTPELRTETAKRLYKQNYEACRAVLDELQKLIDASKDTGL